MGGKNASIAWEMTFPRGPTFFPFLGGKGAVFRTTAGQQRGPNGRSPRPSAARVVGWAENLTGRLSPPCPHAVSNDFNSTPGPVSLPRLPFVVGLKGKRNSKMRRVGVGLIPWGPLFPRKKKRKKPSTIKGPRTGQSLISNGPPAGGGTGFPANGGHSHCFHRCLPKRNCCKTWFWGGLLHHAGRAFPFPRWASMILPPCRWGGC